MGKTIQTLAREAYACIEHVKSKRESGEMIWRTKDGAPQWVTDLCREAHDGMLPDDYKYEYIAAALSHIEDLDEDSDPDDERPEFEADVYNANLLAWLSSNLERAGYVDEAVKAYGGEAGGIMDQIMLGQVAEMDDVYNRVVQALREVDTDEDEE